MPFDKQPSSQDASQQPASETGGPSNSAAQSTAGEPRPPIAPSFDAASDLPKVPFSIHGHTYAAGVQVFGGGRVFCGDTHGGDGNNFDLNMWEDNSRRVIKDSQGISRVYLAEEPQAISVTGSFPSPSPPFAPTQGMGTANSEQASAAGSAQGPEKWWQRLKADALTAADQSKKGEQHRPPSDSPSTSAAALSDAGGTPKRRPNFQSEYSQWSRRQ